MQLNIKLEASIVKFILILWMCQICQSNFLNQFLDNGTLFIGILDVLSIFPLTEAILADTHNCPL